jgi:predicted RNA-binding Zn-ribbon protein involved in translation (DUF1610 family)
MNKIYFAFLVLNLIACRREIDYSDIQEEDIKSSEFDPYAMDITSNEDVEIFHNATGDYPDGTYCAEVEYYNPSTGTKSTYELDVDVENGELATIHWPNGGWLDETHFSPEDISGGEVEFSSDRGYRYTVTLSDFGGGCYSGGGTLQSDVNREVEETTCPICGDDKEDYDELCYSCKRDKEEEEEKEEHTCPKCGGYKSSSYDEYCDDCQDEIDEEE